MDPGLAQVAILVQQLARALAVRLCEQLPPIRIYRKYADDVDHAAHPHLHLTPVWRHLDLTAFIDGWWLMNPDDPCMDKI